MLTLTRQLRRQAVAVITLAVFAAAPAAGAAFPQGPVRGLADYPSGPVHSTLALSGTAA